ncbi:RCC1 domain-containing protein, partial [Chloroflexota bacterium]
MKSKAFKIISLVLTLILLSTMLVFTSPVSAATNPVWAWGQNAFGQLGYSLILHSTEPVQVGGLTDVVVVKGGPFHSLALKLDGTVWAWGDNKYAQLGNAEVASSTVPVQVSGLTGVGAIAAGRSHSLAVQSPDAPSTVGASPVDGATDEPTDTSISWVTVPYVNYDFELSTDANFDSIIADDSNTTSTSYTPSAELGLASQYFWRVRTRAGTLTSDWTTASFTTIGVPPAPPSIASPAIGATDVPVNCTISWMEVPSASYDFQLSTDANFDSLIMNESNTPGTVCTPTEVLT